MILYYFFLLSSEIVLEIVLENQVQVVIKLFWASIKTNTVDSQIFGGKCKYKYVLVLALVLDFQVKYLHLPSSVFSNLFCKTTLFEDLVCCYWSLILSYYLEILHEILTRSRLGNATNTLFFLKTKYYSKANWCFNKKLKQNGFSKYKMIFLLILRCSEFIHSFFFVEIYEINLKAKFSNFLLKL